MNSKLKALSKAVTPSGPKVRTGILVSYSGSYATVNVDGQELFLPMLDSVDSAVPVGSTVVCQVHGSTGYIIGSLNNTSRTASGAYTGSYLNAPVPKPSNLGFSYTNFSVRQVGTFNTDVIPFTVTSTTQTFADSSGNDAFWFYGTNAFTSLFGKNIQSLEIFISPLMLETDSYPITFRSHLSPTRPTGTFSFGSANQTSSSSGWINLNSSFINEFKNNLNAWGIGFYASSISQTINLRPATPYGTIRVGWTN